MKKLAIIASVCAAFGAAGCATPDTSWPKRVSADYEAFGETYGMRAFIYGKRTVLEYPQQPAAWISIRDAEGVSVSYEREGKYIRLSRQLDRFSVWSYSRAVTFTAVKATAAPAPAAAVVPAVASITPAAKAGQELRPVKLQLAQEPSTAGRADLLVHLVSQQIDDLRRDIAAGRFTAGEAKLLKARLNRIESKLEESSMLMQVQFEYGKADFRPAPDVAAALVEAANLAELVNVRGRTDATAPSAGDARIARLRAIAARDFLVDRGVPAEKIKVYSLAAGDHTATSSTPDGRARNRRVDIEFINTQRKAVAVHVAKVEPQQ